MSSTPPPAPAPPPGGGPPTSFPGPGGPAGAGGIPSGEQAEGGTRSPQDSMTRHDQENDAYHCSYGPPQAALAVWDPERELIVRVDRHSGQVIGFSIPTFSAWHAAHGKPDGTFEVDLPSHVPLEQIQGQAGG